MPEQERPRVAEEIMQTETYRAQMMDILRRPMLWDQNEAEQLYYLDSQCDEIANILDDLGPNAEALAEVYETWHKLTGVDLQFTRSIYSTQQLEAGPMVRSQHFAGHTAEGKEYVLSSMQVIQDESFNVMDDMYIGHAVTELAAWKTQHSDIWVPLTARSYMITGPSFDLENELRALLDERTHCAAHTDDILEQLWSIKQALDSSLPLESDDWKAVKPYRREILNAISDPMLYPQGVVADVLEKLYNLFKVYALEQHSLHMTRHVGLDILHPDELKKLADILGVYD